MVALPFLLAAQATEPALNLLPQSGVAALAKSLAAAEGHARHVWRDTASVTDDGVVHAYIEIPRGDRRKFEFDMRANERAIDRVMPESIGGYPVNYGFVPQTVSYDGDPFDALVLGPPLPGGTVVRGVIVGVMYMEDEKGQDAKVVLSMIGSDGRPTDRLTESEQHPIADYFRRYKRHETGKFSKVPGWGPPAEGRQLIAITHAFFEQCRAHLSEPCRVDQ
jgi:inorganic pyrophosphatase